jgi:hypothetical protein
MVMVLRLIFTSVCMPGIIILRPGPLTLWNFPRKNTTPLSYSYRRQTADQRNIAIRTITTNTPVLIPGIITSFLVKPFIP